MKKTKALIYAAFFAALTAVCSQISIPLATGVPVTLQTFSVALTALFLGSKWGAAAVGVYIALGAAGLPVFSGFSGGVGALFGLTGGFIIGFLPMAALAGAGRNPAARIAFSLLGLLCCHMMGAVQFSLLTHRGFFESAALVSLPYLLKDILSILAAYFAAAGLHKLGFYFESTSTQA